tara:strand:- start:766 stop:1380 length:615 start_codon:yes stop_codon:yes gene_type:complete
MSEDDHPNADPQADILLRAHAITMHAVTQMDKQEVQQLAAVDDAHLLAIIARHVLLDAATDELTDLLLLKGAERFSALIAKHRGLATTGWVASKLRVSEETVHERLRSQDLLAIKTAAGHRFPIFQFKYEEPAVWPEIQALLKAAPEEAPESLTRFLLSQVPHLRTGKRHWTKFGWGRLELMTSFMISKRVLSHAPDSHFFVFP